MRVPSTQRGSWFAQVDGVRHAPGQRAPCFGRSPNAFSVLALLALSSACLNPNDDPTRRRASFLRYHGFTFDEAHRLADARDMLDALDLDATGAKPPPAQLGAWICGATGSQGAARAVALWVDRRPVVVVSDLHLPYTPVFPAAAPSGCQAVCGGSHCETESTQVWLSQDGARLVVTDTRFSDAVQGFQPALASHLGLFLGTCAPAVSAALPSPAWPLEGC